MSAWIYFTHSASALEAACHGLNRNVSGRLMYLNAWIIWIRKCDLVGESGSLGMGCEVSKVRVRLTLILSLSLSALPED